MDLLLLSLVLGCSPDHFWLIFGPFLTKLGVQKPPTRLLTLCGENPRTVALACRHSYCMYSACIYIYIYVYIYMYICISIDMCVYIHWFVCLFMHFIGEEYYIHICTYICIYIPYVTLHYITLHYITFHNIT